MIESCVHGGCERHRALPDVTTSPVDEVHLHGIHVRHLSTTRIGGYFSHLSNALRRWLEFLDASTARPNGASGRMRAQTHDVRPAARSS
jgi:hypothetical protein